MRRNRLLLLIALITGIGNGIHAQTIVPAPVDQALINTAPYSYNGMLTVGGAIGSASMVGEGVIATAAHVVYDDFAPAWEPVSSIRFYPRLNNQTFGGSPSGQNFIPAGYYRWDSYSDRVQNDDSGPGLSTPDTFNVDFAAIYFSRTLTDEILAQYAEVNVDQENEVGIMRDAREKMSVGYPLSDQIPSSQKGLMHRTAPADYFCWWGGLEGLEERDSGNLWISIYDFEGVTTYGGASGGPIYAKDDLGNWMFSGILVGSNGSDGMLGRALDEGAWSWIEDAIATRNLEATFRVDDLRAARPEEERVLLQWTDRSTNEAGYLVFRQEFGAYEIIEDLPPDSTSFSDWQIEPGKVYQYRVQPYAANGNRPPKSTAVNAITLGSHPQASLLPAIPWLQLYSTGDSSWFVDEGNRLRSGKVRSLGSSSLTLNILGPGKVTFDWSVSSEVNPEYAIPGAQYEGDIYDAIYLYLNGQRVMNGDEPAFLSGDVSATNLELDLSAGAHTVEWRYEKDPYTDELLDAGFLDSLVWTPSGIDPYPVYGGFQFGDTTWHGSEWLGYYETANWPWAAHENLGWLYVLNGTGYGLFFKSFLDEFGTVYTSPDLFPYLYLVETGSWIYYFEGFGQFGQGVVFWDYTINRIVVIP